MAGGTPPFLMYHELRLPGRAIVDEDPGYSRYVVPLSSFDSQMHAIHARGWRGKSVAQWRRDAENERTVVITFDDGAETDVLSAAPVLEQLGFGATFYLTVGFLTRPGFMSFGQARELASRFEVGCHSMTHAYLDDLDEAGLQREIVDAKHRLEDICGQPVASFSAPGGRYTPRAIEIAKECGYTSFATSEVKLNVPGAPPWELGRVAILGSSTDTAVWSYIDGSGVARQRLRATLLGFGKRVLGNSVYESLRRRLLDRP